MLSEISEHQTYVPFHVNSNSEIFFTSTTGRPQAGIDYQYELVKRLKHHVRSSRVITFILFLAEVLSDRTLRLS